ncbi:MAG: 50S ribosomal protein L32 [Candidatus Omnitrophica bacterium CG02_land_8_20_14_3_00__42_8]|nr:MAG: 50S ribosomal protein L32 [Candidatus Omnitrophica bacterium CG02_land_8_20_14_3_00__42_8]PIW67546.1 MAG: 50S ribosomal protein L32 [Candidatus Omnitrophica bacterium CG12_big_fil_rev_8_21_14_0_65_42_8]
MALPKRRHSSSRQGKRRGSQKIHVQSIGVCPNCKSPKLPHRVCSVCGYYKGRQVMQIKEKKKREKK